MHEPFGWDIDLVPIARDASHDFLARWFVVHERQSQFRWAVSSPDVLPAIEMQVLELAGIEDGWNGPGSQGISLATLTSAASFARTIVGPSGSVSPTSSGEILFEWDFHDDISVFAHANESGISVTMFDTKQSYVDISLVTDAAARLVSLLIEVNG